MKKIPLFLKFTIPIFIAVVVAGAFFVIMLTSTTNTLIEKKAQVKEAEAYPDDINKADYKSEKLFNKFDEDNYINMFFLSYEEDALAKFELGNTKFVSYSESWDKDKLEALSVELFANTHGDEIYEIDYVTLTDLSSYSYPPQVDPDYDSMTVPVSLFEMFPYDYTFFASLDKNVLHLYSCGYYDTVETLAPQLSYAYGRHYINYYFNIYGDDIVEDDPYFKLRYDDNYNIYYKEDDYDDYEMYGDIPEWYLLEIAAYDYAYLMGSPNSKKVFVFKDTYEQLELSVKNKDKEFDDYFYNSIYDYFNEAPHLNAVLPLPDTIEGLPNLFYNAIGKTSPKFDAHSQAEEINIEVNKRTKYGKPYYSVTWNKPFDESGVKYTLVGYDENNVMLGAIKTIDSSENSRAIFGCAVYDGPGTSYTYRPSDYWYKLGFVRLRVIVTFSDGTAAISPSLDWSFE